MLDYIKSQIKSRMPENESTKNNTVDDIPNDVIVEYAHIFQELDDISVEGSEVDKARKMSLDIPFEDEDIEIDSIEFNLNDGRVTDVPGDATVQEEYSYMKTYDKFYQEAAESMTRMPRESDSMFHKRVSDLARKNYEEYCETAAEQGLFGFDDISISDSRVPSKLNIDFGPIELDSDKSYMTRLKTFFATDKDHNISKKQLDSVNLVRNGAFSKIGQPLTAYMESKYDIPTGTSVWDVVTPINLYVPRGNADSFCVVLEYMNEITNKKEYFGWTRAVSHDAGGSIENVVQESCIDDCEKINMESFVNETHYENHDTVIQESAAREELASRRHFSRFYQEAIDFGGADGGSDLPPTEGDNASDGDTSTDTASDNTSDADTTVDAGDTSETPESNDDSSDDKEEAAVNNVSKEIAEKVSEKTQEDIGDDTASSDESSVSFDDDDMSEGNDIEGGASVEDQLDDLDNSTSDVDSDADDTDMSDDDTDTSTGDIDFDNLTIDQLIEQGSEKLKGMTLQEIKDFLSSGSEEAVQEAFILTKKNINIELDNNIRKALGILNDNQMDLDKLLKKFKLAGKKLNRVLTKAIKMKDVYSTDEVQSIQKLNKILVDLLSSLKNSKDSSYVSKIKNLIREFVSQCKIVGSFVEDKLNGGTSAAIQEGFVQEGLFLSEKNAKSRLASKIPPVYDDMMEIVKTNEEGKLTKGKISKMYKPKTKTHMRADAIGGFDESVHEISTSQMNNIDSLAKIVSKILRKDKIQRAFNSDEISKLDELSDKLDDFVDFIESLVYDSGYKESLIKQVAKDAKKIADLLNEIHEFSSDSDSDSLSDKNNVAEDVPSEDTSVDDTDDTAVEDVASEEPDFDDEDTSSDDNDSSDDEEEKETDNDEEEDDE